MLINDEIKMKVLVRLAKDIELTLISEELNIPIAIIEKLKKENSEEIKKIKLSLDLRVLIELKKYDLVIYMAKRSIYESDPAIQSQMLTAYLSMNRIDKAIEICENSNNQNCESIVNRKAKILKLKRKKEEQKTRKNDPEVIILNRINTTSITLDEINNSDISIWHKVLLTIAYYDKYNYSKDIRLNYLMDQIINYKDNEEALNILALIKTRISKRKKFNYDFYQSILSFNINISQEKEQLMMIRDNLTSSLKL